MDMVVDDPAAPFGLQLAFPFSEPYFISPSSIFPSFDYYDPALGIFPALFSTHNLFTILQEIFLLATLVALACYFRVR